jgi:hypothetical protein
MLPAQPAAIHEFAGVKLRGAVLPCDHESAAWDGRVPLSLLALLALSLLALCCAGGQDSGSEHLGISDEVGTSSDSGGEQGGQRIAF